MIDGRSMPGAPASGAARVGERPARGGAARGDAGMGSAS
jgi:hypothetical protein